jgi:limonene-1,2-epoxide hydrolase
MADASEVVKAWMKAVVKGGVEKSTDFLHPKLDWLENGLSHEESIAKYPRPKWEGIKSKTFKYSAKKVCGDDKSVVMEFTASFGGKDLRYCGVFKVSRGKITSAHWYGDASQGEKVILTAKRA